MVHYIRFFKTPRFSLNKKSNSKSVSAVVTIQNDLGDLFLQSPVQLLAELLILDDEQNEQSFSQKLILWSGKSESLTIQFPPFPPSLRFKLHVSEAPHESRSALTIPRILPAWSAPFGAENEAADALVERRFALPGEARELRIWEQSGNSIACHIWDAALGFILLLRDLNDALSNDKLLPILRAHINQSNSLPSQAIELGSGCGIVGILLRKLFAFCSVILTDLAEAKDILECNLLANREAHLPSSLMYQTFNWGTDVEVVQLIDDIRVHLIVVSDCTYNPSSAPALVQTFASLTRQSQASQVLILVAMKRRHESEAVFFDMMSDAGFVTAESARIALPSFEQGNYLKEIVEFFVFCRNGSPTSA